MRANSVRLILFILSRYGCIGLGSLGFCRLLSRRGWFRREEHGHVPALKLGAFVHIGDFRTFFRKILQQDFAYLGMRHLSAAEAHGDLDSVSVRKEFLSVFQLGVKVIRINAGRHANLLYFDDALILLSFLFLFPLFETELAIVHYLAHGRDGARSDFNQIKVVLFGDFQRFFGRHNSELLAFYAYNAHFLICNLLVDLMNSVCDMKHLR